MSTQTLNPLLEKIEVTILEQWFDTPHCQSAHKSYDNKVCTHQVVYMIDAECMKNPKQVCAANGERNLRAIENPAFTCYGCIRPAGECWTVVPII